MTQMLFAVNWDNGNEACGTFPQRFQTEEEAQLFADNWANISNLIDLGLSPEEVEERGGEDCYTAEVIEVYGDESEDTEGEGWDEFSELRNAALDRKGRP